MIGLDLVGLRPARAANQPAGAQQRQRHPLILRQLGTLAQFRQPQRASRDRDELEDAPRLLG